MRPHDTKCRLTRRMLTRAERMAEREAWKRATALLAEHGDDAAGHVLTSLDDKFGKLGASLEWHSVAIALDASRHSRHALRCRQALNFQMHGPSQSDDACGKGVQRRGSATDVIRGAGTRSCCLGIKPLRAFANVERFVVGQRHSP